MARGAALNVTANVVEKTDNAQAYATADVFYEGALLERSLVTGLCSPLGTGTAPRIFLGVCNKTKTTAASSETKISFDRRGAIPKGTGSGVAGIAVTGVTGDLDVGKVVYAVDDDISAGLTLTSAAGTNWAIGRVHRYISGTSVWIKLFTPEEALDNYWNPSPVPVETFTAALPITRDHFQRIFTNRGAVGALTVTLPAVLAAMRGAWVEIHVVAGQNVTLAGTAGQIVTFNNAAAASVAYQTATELIGGAFRATCDGTSWIITIMAEETQTTTVA